MLCLVKLVLLPAIAVCPMLGTWFAVPLVDIVWRLPLVSCCFPFSFVWFSIAGCTFLPLVAKLTFFVTEAFFCLGQPCLLCLQQFLCPLFLLLGIVHIWWLLGRSLHTCHMSRRIALIGFASTLWNHCYSGWIEPLRHTQKIWYFGNWYFDAHLVLNALGTWLQQNETEKTQWGAKGGRLLLAD